jgi:P27 family predicted phage terminase small subunit
VNVAPKLTTAPMAPDNLPATAQAAWNDLAPILVRANLLDETNLVTFRGLCLYLARAEQAREAIAAGEPLTVTDDRGTMTENPVYAIERRAWQMVLKLAVEFGLTPSARARLGLTIAAGMTLAQELEQTVGRPAREAMEAEAWELPDL